MVRIDGTNIDVSRLGLGTASLHHRYSRAARQDILKAAWDVGITHFDTSPYYGYGVAELDIGVFLKGCPREAMTLTTKVGLYPWGPASSGVSSVWCRKALGRIYQCVSLPVVNWTLSRARHSLQLSLGRLGTNYVDFLFLHEPVQDLLNTDEFLGWLESLVSQGVIRAWGVAGLAAQVEPLVVSKCPLASVVQTRDSLNDRWADFLLAQGRLLQFTYGYLSGHKTGNSRMDCEEVMEQALCRNRTGCVLFSSRKAERIRRIGKLGE
jgi:aryl-alcohol dehydrogenase-like predicted oxidoreductase